MPQSPLSHHLPQDALPLPPSNRLAVPRPHCPATQFLAQIPHPHTPAKQGGKACLEWGCERVKGAEADADHPPPPPPDDPRHPPDIAEQPFINWRAFSFTFFVIVLVSLLWEATLALPYGWWGYRATAMLGLTIGAWSQLPVEAVSVWLAASFTTVIGYEVVKIWLATGKRALEAFFGVQRP